MTRKPDISSYDLLIVDIDGVVLRGSEPIEGSIEALNRAIEVTEVVFVTNNSTRTRESISVLLRDLGLEWVDFRRVITSASALAKLVGKIGVRRCFVIGEEGLMRELERSGVKTSDSGDVCVGLDREFDYRKLSRAAELIRQGSLFLVTNEDSTLPIEGGRFLPGAGSIVSAISVASGRSPDVVVGKPSPEMLLEAKRMFKAERPLVIGDRPETDILAAIRGGMDSVLVLTGATRERDWVVPRPTYVERSLASLILGE